MPLVALSEPAATAVRLPGHVGAECVGECRVARVQVQSIAMTEGNPPGVCSISSREALNIDIRGATQMTQLTQEQLDAASLKLTVGQKEKALQRLQADMWLGKDDDGNVTLGVRRCVRCGVPLLRCACQTPPCGVGPFQSTTKSVLRAERARGSLSGGAGLPAGV